MVAVPPVRGLTLKTLCERIRNPIAAICLLANHHSDMALHARSNAMDFAFCKPCTSVFLACYGEVRVRTIDKL